MYIRSVLIDLGIYMRWLDIHSDGFVNIRRCVSGGSGAVGGGRIVYLCPFRIFGILNGSYGWWVQG